MLAPGFRVRWPVHVGQERHFLYPQAVNDDMGLFNKKKEEKSCCCGSGCTPEKMAQAEAAKTTAGIKVLGAGCAKCHALEDATKAALAELNMDTTIDHVTDVSQLAAYGVMTTPALVVDGKVVSYGKVLKKDEVKALIQKVRG